MLVGVAPAARAARKTIEAETRQVLGLALEFTVVKSA